MNVIDYVINIDWLSCSVYGEISSPPIFFEVKDTGNRNRLFLSVSELYYNGEHIATLQSSPSSPLLRKDLIIVKFENHVLYREGLIDFVQMVIKSWNWIFNNVNRLDIALDFQKLNNGMKPQFLVAGLFDGSIIKKNARCQVFHGVDKNNIDNLYKTKNNNLVAYFNKEVNFNSSSITGYRSGSRASAVCTYLYNKTLELKQIKDKPYIREIWRRCGFNENTDTWRLEFSLKGKQFDNIRLDDLRENKLFNLANSLVATYFELRSKVDDTFVPLTLFNNSTATQILLQKTRKSNADKSAKLFISRIIVEIHNQSQSNESNAESLRACLRYTLYEYVQQYGLLSYARRKLLNYNLIEEYNMMQPADR